jgi:hypothetical protein
LQLEHNVLTLLVHEVHLERVAHAPLVDHKRRRVAQPQYVGFERSALASTIPSAMSRPVVTPADVQNRPSCT